MLTRIDQQRAQMEEAIRTALDLADATEDAIIACYLATALDALMLVKRSTVDLYGLFGIVSNGV